MKRYVLTFGIVVGTIIAGHMVYMVDQVCSNPDMETNDLVGYAAMVVVFSLIFFGIRNYRNKELSGIITFGKAFKTGALIALLASTMYVVVWLFYYYLFVPEFMDIYTSHVLRDAAKNGATEAALADKAKEMAEFTEMYKNPVLVVLLSYAEILPVGLVVALISSLILKRKPTTSQPQPL
ncbi:MAG TPA: DUF4199 family protein [Chryseolinea sp.]|nr:DUF4199 family protein [Chryseolinea sp.]